MFYLLTTQPIWIGLKTTESVRGWLQQCIRDGFHKQETGSSLIHCHEADVTVTPVLYWPQSAVISIDWCNDTPRCIRPNVPITEHPEQVCYQSPSNLWPLFTIAQHCPCWWESVHWSGLLRTKEPGSMNHSWYCSVLLECHGNLSMLLSFSSQG